MAITHIMLLVICFSLPELAFTGTAYRNADRNWGVPWTSSIQTYQMKIVGVGYCSVFMVSPTFGITAAHCFGSMMIASPEFASQTTIPNFIETHSTVSLYAADNTIEISKVEAAFITSFYFDDLRKSHPGTNKRILSGDFAYIRVNPKIEIQEDVLFASGKILHTTPGVVAGCRYIDDGKRIPRCCMMQLSPAFPTSTMEGACLAKVLEKDQKKHKTSSKKTQDCSQFITGFSGGPVTVVDDKNGKTVVGYCVGGFDQRGMAMAVINNLDVYVPLIKDLIAADDEANATGEPTRQKRFSDFIEIVFRPPPTTPSPTPPNAGKKWFSWWKR